MLADAAIAVAVAAVMVVIATSVPEQQDQIERNSVQPIKLQFSMKLLSKPTCSNK